MAMMSSIFKGLVSTLVACAVLAAQATSMPSEAIAQQSQRSERRLANFKLQFLQEQGSIKSAIFDDTNAIVMFRAILNEREVWAVLDTGSEATLIDIQFAEAAGLKVVSKGGGIETGKNTLARSVVHGVRLKVPGQFEIPADFNGVDLTGLAKALSKDVKVVLGRDILNALSFYLDTKLKRIVFVPSRSMKVKDEQVFRIPMTDGLLNGRINGAEATLAIDLGATGALQIQRGAWDRYIGSNASLGEVTSKDLTGKTYKSIFTQGVSIDVGPINSRFAAKQIPDLNKRFDAYLGYRFFQGRRILFDYAADEILILKE
ncbi:retropepsin-like domain-containing protein [Erythrobacter sp. NFXS35]|uniref:retropepsin-like aspartic protease n=1 Tax=Erythrobacter sp. NFXS35 TaxID=2818436 RepID=UPI0032DFDB12